MKIHRGIRVFVLTFALFLAGVYLFWCFALGKILSSDYAVNFYENFIAQKVGLAVDIKNFKFNTNPDLSFVACIGGIQSAADEISVEGLEYKSKRLSLKPEKVDANKIHIDYQKVKKLIPSDGSSKVQKFDIKKFSFPVVNISDVLFKFDDKTSARISEIVSEKQNNKITAKFVAEITAPYFNSPVYVGKSGSISYRNGIEFDNLQIKNKNSDIYLNNKITDLHITGTGLSVADLEETFLGYYKIRYNGRRNFIENFTDFKGTLDVDITYNKKNGFSGNCLAKSLGADFSKFKIPVYLPEVLFKFENRDISAVTNGTFGGEPAYTDVLISGVGTPGLHTKGNVKSTLTPNFSRKHFPQIMISGGADASVIYDVKDGIVNIDYSLKVKKGSNLLTKHGGLGMTDRIRLLDAHTVKHGDDIKLSRYGYFVSDNGKDYTAILSGDGLFRKIAGKYGPVEVSVKTNGNIPVEVIRSFIDDYLESGMFSANLKYNFLTKTLVGSANLYDVRRSNFLYMKRITAIAAKNNIKLSTDGIFFGSPITFSLDADNHFEHGLVINDLDVHLNRFKLRRVDMVSVKTEFDAKRLKYSSKSPRGRTSDYPIEVKKGKILVDHITHSKFDLYNVALYGKFKNKIADFVMPETGYAKGILSATGKYNVENHSSDIHFVASEIDSNEVVTNFFKLPGQMEGLAYATLHLKTRNKLNDIWADATFAIEDGFLPKLGSREFVIRPNKFKRALFNAKKPIKFTLSKICNIDFSKPNVFYSGLKGSFVLDNDMVKDVKMFSVSDNLSMYIEGSYNIDTQFGHLVIWGKRNKVSDRTIKIFKIPLGVLYKFIFKAEKSMDENEDKVKLIPPIKAEPYETSVFRVNADGDLNSNNIKLRFKDIRSGHKK